METMKDQWLYKLEEREMERLTGDLGSETIIPDNTVVVDTHYYTFVKTQIQHSELK